MSATDPSHLYGLPLESFVPERGALAKALRGAGEKEDAARVAALRKPSVAAWTVNQLIRTQPTTVAALFDAGDELQQAQVELLAGRGDALGLREATRAERRAVDELVAVARGLLSSEGQEPTQATLDRVSDTLHAAALDEDARAQVRDGCLERELRQVGFGAGGFDSPAVPTGGGSGSGRKRSSGDGAERGATSGGDTATASTAAPDRKRAATTAVDRAVAQRESAAAAERAERERERVEHRRSARMAAADARRHAELTVRQLATAQERRDRAADSLREAEEALAAARERADEAELAHQRAQQLLGDR